MRLISCLSWLQHSVVVAAHTERLASVLLSTRGRLSLLQQLKLGKGSLA